MTSDEPGSPWGGPEVAEGPLLVDDARLAQDAAVAEVPAQASGPAPQPTVDDLPPRPLTRDGRLVRAPQPGRLSPARAVAGAAVSVAGVALGIGTLLWVTEDPQNGTGPVVQAAAADARTEPAPPPAETEQAPVDLPAVAPPTTVAVVPPAAAPPALASAAPAATSPSAVVPVTVLNNSNRTGLADRAAARFVRGGWPVRLTGNFRGQIPVTTVYYDPGFEVSARAFARAFGGIVRVRPRFASLPAHGVVVVLTREFGA